MYDYIEVLSQYIGDMANNTPHCLPRESQPITDEKRPLAEGRELEERTAREDDRAEEGRRVVERDGREDERGKLAAYASSSDCNSRWRSRGGLRLRECGCHAGWK